MKYSRVQLSAIGYELAPVVVTSDELEERLQPLYQRLHLQPGQLEALTGIRERRWWEPDFPLSEGAARAARQALEGSGVTRDDIDVLLYAGVCRESFEPATACHVADRVGVSADAAVYDISNACLGVMNGILDIANRIELGQIRAGLVTCAETAREIVEVTIDSMIADADLAGFTQGLATLTGGSGAAAVLLTDGSFDSAGNDHRLVAGVNCTAPEHHQLCRWGLGAENGNDAGAVHLHRQQPLPQRMVTDSVAVLTHGVELGMRTWNNLLAETGWRTSDVDRVVSHQVGGAHRDTILSRLELQPEQDFVTFPFLGNIGTVSLPLTAAIAEERGKLKAGQKVAFLGIGSGLNCLMLGWQW